MMPIVSRLCNLNKNKVIMRKISIFVRVGVVFKVQKKYIEGTKNGYRKHFEKQ